MHKKYYIANNGEYYTYSGGVDDMTKALRATHHEAESIMLSEKKRGIHWIIRKPFNDDSGINYVLSTIKFFVKSNGSSRTANLCEAMSFKSVDNAVKWMYEHDAAKILDDVPCVINSNFIKVYSINGAARRTKIKKDLREQIYEASDKKCAICGKPLELSEITIDHIVPLSRGGSNEIDNYRILCYSCNQFKGDRLDEEMYDGMIDILAAKLTKSYDVDLVNKLARAVVRSYLAGFIWQ